MHLKANSIERRGRSRGRGPPMTRRESRRHSRGTSGSASCRLLPALAVAPRHRTHAPMTFKSSRVAALMPALSRLPPADILVSRSSLVIWDRKQAEERLGRGSKLLERKGADLEKTEVHKGGPLRLDGRARLPVRVSRRRSARSSWRADSAPWPRCPAGAPHPHARATAAGSTPRSSRALQSQGARRCGDSARPRPRGCTRRPRRPRSRRWCRRRCE
mmetsp:Transcript_13176/g.44649  ORF Transcript_13176/g.44649 Transcript_13176/m.44649 type:complete len:217 (+) Transcript_13176:111-761(+)